MCNACLVQRCQDLVVTSPQRLCIAAKLLVADRRLGKHLEVLQLLGREARLRSSMISSDGTMGAHMSMTGIDTACCPADMLLTVVGEAFPLV